jgi:hypothetical protein
MKKQMDYYEKLKSQAWRNHVEITLTLGDKVVINKHVFTFCKVTSKGFNFIHDETHKSITPRRHYYDKRWAGKQIPRTEETFTVKVPPYLESAIEWGKKEKVND